MRNIADFLINEDSAILDALKIINESSSKIAVVCDTNKVLRGVVTDGDIRRGLLNHFELTAPVSDIMCQQPVFAYKGTTTKDMLSIMQSEQVYALPIVNDKKQLCGVETFMHASKLYNRSTAPVFLMAGGFGTRLHPLTENCPKPLLKVGKRPLLESIIRSFQEYGFKNFYVSVHYLSHQIKDYFGDGAGLGVNIKYIEESSPLGTAGALSLIDGNITEPMIVMNGDLLTKVDFSALLEFHSDTKSMVTMCVREHITQVPYGVIEYEDIHVNRVIEKPVRKDFVNAGIYVLSPELVNQFDKETVMDMPDLINQVIEGDEKITMFPLHEYWLDIGRLSDFEKAQSDVLELFE